MLYHATESQGQTIVLSSSSLEFSFAGSFAVLSGSRSTFLWICDFNADWGK